MALGGSGVRIRGWDSGLRALGLRCEVGIQGLGLRGLRLGICDLGFVDLGFRAFGLGLNVGLKP